MAVANCYLKKPMPLYWAMNNVSKSFGTQIFIWYRQCFRQCFSIEVADGRDSAVGNEMGFNMIVYNSICNLFLSFSFEIVDDKIAQWAMRIASTTTFGTQISIWFRQCFSIYVATRWCSTVSHGKGFKNNIWNPNYNLI